MQSRNRQDAKNAKDVKTLIDDQITVDGFAAVQAETGALALTLIPALGGKISSLRDTRSGREWLWRHPRMPYAQVPYGSSYTALADTGGWDECFPTVAACAYPAEPWHGVPLQDHGELWGQQPELTVAQTAGALALTSRWHGGPLPCTFERTIGLTAGSATIRLDYTVTNTGRAPIQWIWSAHPLLALEPGMRLELPPEARYHCSGATPPDLVAVHGLRFPQVGPNLNLDPLPGREAAIALKLWSEPLTDGWAALHAADGALRMRWDTALLPQVAFWLNCGAWAADGGAPYYNLGLEPCSGAQDSLEQAVRERLLFETLPPGAERRWWLEVTLG